MKIKKIFMTASIGALGFLTLNVNSYASNSYYLMSCTEQNIPTGYYASIDTSVSEGEFRQTLHDVISNDYVQFTYSQAWDIDYYADADPYSEGHVRCLYTNQSVENGSHISNGGKLYWNREHTWPKSHGFNDENCAAYTDCHHLRAAESAINIAKSNNDFGELTSDYTESFGNKYAGGVFEPKDDIKGDVARMLLYMMIRYGEYDDTTMSWNEKKLDEDGNVLKDDNGKDITEKKTEKIDLLLVDDSDTTSNSNGNGRLAKLSTLLKWHYQDPVSEREIYQNNVVYMFQKNRNPFIDHPEYVEYAFANSGTYVEPAQKDPIQPDDQVRTEEFAIDDIGFEAEEGFAAVTSSKYYTKNKYQTSSSEWAGYNAVPATVGALSGSQSMRLSVQANSENKAQFFMTEDIYNLSKVSFKAKGSTSGLALNVMYSLDSGITWQTGETFNLTTTSKQYEYVVSTNGGYDKVRIGFVFDSTPSSNSYINLDDISIYKFKTDAGTEFSRETTKASLKFNYDENVVVVQGGYQYQLAKDVSDIKVGDEIVIAALDYSSYPYAMGALKTTNHAQEGIVVSDEKITNLGSANVLTVCAGSTSETIALKNSSNKYLGNESTGKDNYLKCFSEIKTTTSWNLSINSSTHAVSLVIAESTVPRNTLRYNATNGLFSCYASGQKDIAIYVKVTGNYEKTEYTYKNMVMRFGTFLDKDLYEYILTADENATFGVALSKDGVEYEEHDCNPVMVLVNNGLTVEDPNGTYVQWDKAVSIEKENYDSLVYAKVYVKINGVTYYTGQVCYSVKTLAQKYYDDQEELKISKEVVDLLNGLLQ